jgi:hypothetical protein
VFSTFTKARSGHHDGGWYSQPLRVPGDALRVVAGRDRDDAAGALAGVQRQQAVQRAAFLERGGELQVLELQVKLAAGDRRQRARVQEGVSATWLRIRSCAASTSPATTASAPMFSVR